MNFLFIFWFYNPVHCTQLIGDLDSVAAHPNVQCQKTGQKKVNRRTKSSTHVNRGRKSKNPMWRKWLFFVLFKFSSDLDVLKSCPYHCFVFVCFLDVCVFRV